MPREIADSDDELEAEPSLEIDPRDVVANVATPNEQGTGDQSDPLADTIFDEFLSPTQRLSSAYDGRHDNIEELGASNVLDSSTDRFLKALGVPSPSTSPDRTSAYAASQYSEIGMGGKRKGGASRIDNTSRKKSRTQIELEDTSTKEQHQGANRRAKTTYGSSSTTGTKSASTLDFQAMINAGNEDVLTGHGRNEHKTIDGGVTEPSETVSIDARSDYTSPLDLSLHLSPSDGVPPLKGMDSAEAHQTLATAHLSMNSFAPRGNFFGANLSGGTASRSSMGNYQSFTINPEKLGMDFDRINPFGSLSQVSLPGDIDSQETRGIAEIFRNNVSRNSGTKFVDETETSRNTVHDSKHSDNERRTKDKRATKASKKEKAEQNTAQCSPPFSQITDSEDPIETEPNHQSQDNFQVMSVTSATAEVKAMPKKRGRKPKKADASETQQNDQDDTDELLPHVKLPDRATRAGTVDSTSNVSEISQGTTVSKTDRKLKSVKPDMGPPELQSKKLPSSDLGLDNKAVIGLSPERYVPRPSRRRGRAGSEVQSEVPSTTPGSSQTRGVVLEEEPRIAENACTKSPPTKGKKGRKSKVKRAKTSAAALLKQRDEFLDEDEREEAKEVVFMDEQPAKVKFLPLSDFSPNRKLKLESSTAEVEANGGEEDVKSGSRRAKISVDIPTLPKPNGQQEVPPPMTEPKKRGRKRKKLVDDTPREDIDTEIGRKALSEIDHNIQASKRPALGSPVSSDLSKQDENSAGTTEESTKGQKEHTPVPETEVSSVTTPIKADATASLSRTHSSSSSKPRSSTPLFNARARIGLSKRHSIPSLLRRVDRNKEAPKAIERKEKLNKWQLEEKEQERIAKEEAEAEGREYKPLDQLRGKDGMLVEWDF